MKETVLVTDGTQRAALAVTRSLGKAGYRVVVAAPRVPCLAGASRWCSEQHEAPDPLADPDGFARDVTALARRTGARVLLPVTEEALTAILPESRRPSDVIVPFPPEPVFRVASDKARIGEEARAAGLAVPPQVTVRFPPPLPDPGSRAFGPLAFPVVAKPSRSVVEAHGCGVKLAVRHAPDEPSLGAILSTLPAEAFPVLVQERIVGPGVGAFLLLHGGRRLAAFTHRRLREKPPAGGVSVLAESTEPDVGLLDAAEALLRRLAWDGVAMVEFKRDRRTGMPYLMEVNARFWGSLQLAIDAGVDFPRLLVEAALGHAVRPVTAYRVGVRTRWWWGDVDHLIARLRRSPEALSLPPGAPSRLGAVRDFLATTFDPRVRNEVCRLSDPAPALRETLEWFRAG